MIELHIIGKNRGEFEQELDKALRADKELRYSVNRIAGNIIAEEVRAKLRKEQNLIIPASKKHS